MVERNSNKRKFKQMSYRDVQKTNSKNRSRLKQEDRQWLQENKYKNIGWNNVINLYQKIEEFLDKYRWDNLTLEELFLEADRIGNKYQTDRERAEFERKLSQEVNEIAEEIDRQFPDREIEVIDFSKKTNHKLRKKSKQKS